MMWDDGDGRWTMHDGDGAGWLMVLLMLVVAIAVVVAVVALLRGGTSLSTTPHGAPGARGPDPRAILQERFARGEIDEQEFRTRMRALDESSG
jgi:putative membrane protein